MQFTDVTSEYLKCHFCGMGLRRETAHKDAKGHLFHTRECYEFSKGYKDLVARLEAVTKDRSSAD